MFPTTSFIALFTTFVLELCSTSPVYNMQPAFITAHIGSTGRNIRNLPCVSRKTNEKGVCMFAINCLKANGTHLGTCIDKFYFGSCCRIPPLNDVVENSIDSDIIPSREPPNRLSTLKPLTSTTSHEEAASNSTSPKPSVKISTTAAPTPAPTKEEPSPTTSSPKLTTFLAINGASSTQTTTKPPSTTLRPSSTASKTSSTTPKPFSTPSKISSTTSKPFSTPSKTSSTTSKPFSTPSKTSSTASKPPSTVSKPSSAFSTKKPFSTTQKPLKTTKYTKKPQVSTVRIPVTTRKPVGTTKSTKKPVATKKPTTTTKFKPTTTKRTSTPSSTIKTTSTPTPSLVRKTTTSTTPISSTPVRTKPSSSSTSGVPVTKAPTSASSTTPRTPSPTTSNVLVTTKPLVSATSSGTILNVTTGKPGLVTWTVDDETRKNSSSSGTTTESIEDGLAASTSSTTEDWRPIKTTISATSSDSWVLIPSVSSSPPKVETPTTEGVKFNSTTAKPTGTVSSGASSVSTSSPPPPKVPTFSTVSTSSPLPPKVPTFSTISTASPPASSSFQTTQSTMISTSSPPTPTATTQSTPSGDGDSNAPKPVNMSDFTNVCGRRMYPEARIVGGEKSSFGKWPWQISLRQWRTSTYLHKCGAALLNENWAITAAHCVDNVPPSDLLLRLGEHDLSTESEPYLHQERRVQIVASHPQFDPRTFEYDLALLRFYEPVTFQPNIIPVCVPQSDENFVGRTAHVTGWGRLYEDGPLPSVLQEVSVPVINNSVCESMYRSAGYIEHIPHIFICAGWRRGGFDSCEGDSGGPMVIQREDKRFLLAGIISWGIGCAEPNQPGVYTRISEFRDWINQILQF